MAQPKLHKWKLSSYQPDPQHPRYVVDCPLRNMISTADVYWTEKHKNSYCLVEVPAHNTWLANPERAAYFYFRDDRSPTGFFEIASINGAGEIRWTITKDRLEQALQHEKESWWDPNASWDDHEYLEVARYFGLTPRKAA